MAGCLTKYVNATKIGSRGRSVVNVSTSGARIRDLIPIVRDFYETSEAARDNDIEKIIFSIGTNDIKFSRNGVGHLKKYIIDLIESTKNIFPAAIVIFQCCLPIKELYSYIANNVIDFNCMLRNVCMTYNCVYLDCFRDFLTPYSCSVNSNLYYDWLHLNAHGVSVLAKWLKFVVRQNSFDRVTSKIF